MSKRLVFAMTSLVALVAIALAIPMAVVVATDQRAAFVADLETDTLATGSLLSSQPFIDWQQTVMDVAARTGGRVVVVDQQRTLVADSDDSGLDRSFDRPEIDDALGGVVASDVRFSQTLGTDLRYVAAPVVQNYQVVAAVRLSLPEYDVDDAIQGTLMWLSAFVLSVIVAAGLIAWLLARSIAAPLQRLAGVAESLPEDLELRADENSGPREVRMVASALNETAVRLSNILSRTQRVAADASHHLRTPLTGVRLRLEAIEDTAPDTDLANEASAAIAEVDRLTHRIEQILALARSDTGGGELRSTDVVAAVAERTSAATPLAADRGIQLDAELPQSPAYVQAPAGVIEQVIDELIGNALTYCRSRVHLRVRIHNDSHGSWVLLEVMDDGPGLREEEHTKVFERFVRGSDSVIGGSGLGLALVSESAEGLGGSASLGRSDLGGLRVEVRLPNADGLG